MPETNHVPAAIAILIISDDSILLGKRFNGRQFEGWQCPGGFLLRGESLEECARRICREKAGLEINELTQGPLTNNIFPNTQPPLHTITQYFIARHYQVYDEERFADEQYSWQWFDRSAIPEPRFLPLELLLAEFDPWLS